MRAFAPVLAVLGLSGCGNSGPVPPPPPPPEVAAPQVTGTFPDLELTAGGSPVAVQLSQAISGEVAEWSATSSDANVAVVSVGGDGHAEVRPVRGGTAQITITARNAGGTAEDTFTVRVLPHATTAPFPLGPLAAPTLGAGARSFALNLAGAFSPPGFALAVRSLDPGVVAASVSGSTLTLIPLAAGSTTVEITARNTAGSAVRVLPVRVVASPAATGSIEPLALVAGTAPTVVNLAPAFSPPTGLSFRAAAQDQKVAVASVAGSELTVTPIAPGTTEITITAENAAGSATHGIRVVVVAESREGVPQPVGTLAPLMLGTDSESVFVDVGASFTPRGFSLEARSRNPRVASVSVHSDTALRVTPVGAGRTVIEVTARNAFGSGSRELQVEVVGPPSVFAAVQPLFLTIGAPPTVVDLRNAFAPPGFEVDARSLNEGVVAVSVGAGPSLTLTPAAVGRTSVEVTARNGSGSATLSIAVTVAAATPTAPRITGGLGGRLSFINGEAARSFDAQRWFAPAGVSVEARSLDTGIVTVSVAGSVVTITPVGPGRTTVEVTARNTSGSATQTITVTVAGEAPQAVGMLAPISLAVGGSALDIDLTDLFTPTGVHYTYASANPGIVTAELRGTVLTLTPAARGTTTVRAGARNALGSATHTISVTVTAPDALRAVGTLAPVSLIVGGEPATVDVANAFTPAGFAVRAASGRERVATVQLDGTVLTITPVGEGTTTVFVNASSASGTAQHRISVTVAASTSATVDLADVTLSAGGETLDVDVARAFAFSNFTVEARSGDTGIVTVAVNGTVLTLTPVSAGKAVMEVTGRPDSGNSSAKSFYVTVLPMAPQPVGTLDAVTLRDEGPAVEVDVADAFTPTDVTITARYTGNVANIAVTVRGTVVTVMPRGRGNNVVEVTATNATGSAIQTFQVTVLPQPPEVVGTMDAVALVDGGASAQRNFWSAFEGIGLRLEARSNDTRIVTAAMDDDRWAVFTPAGVGDTTVVVTARNAGGSASHTISVSVVTAVPKKTATLGPSTVRLDGRYLVVYISEVFTPANLKVSAQSQDTQVVTAEVTTDGPDRTPIVKVTPVRLGTTNVVITGSTADGSVSYTWEVTVEAPPG